MRTARFSGCLVAGGGQVVVGGVCRGARKRSLGQGNIFSQASVWPQGCVWRADACENILPCPKLRFRAVTTWLQLHMLSLLQIWHVNLAWLVYYLSHCWKYGLYPCDLRLMKKKNLRQKWQKWLARRVRMRVMSKDISWCHADCRNLR